MTLPQEPATRDTSSSNGTTSAVRHAVQYGGADAGEKIKAAMDDLPVGGGIVDARGFGATRQTISNPIVLGDPARPVSLIVDGTTYWNIAVTGDVDAIQIADGSGITCLAPVGVGTAGVIKQPGFHVGSTAEVRAVVAPLNREGKQNVLYVSGCNFFGNRSARVSSAIIDLQGIFLNSFLRDVNVLVPYNTIGLRIRPGTGEDGGLRIVSDINIDNVQVNGNAVEGARPCVIESAPNSAVGNINFIGGGCQHPAAGGIALEIDGKGTPTGISGLNFYGFHVEGQHSTDTLVSIVDAMSLLFDGVQTSGAYSRAFYIAESREGLTDNVTIRSLYNSTDSALLLDNAISHKQLSGITLGSYTFATRSFADEQDSNSSGKRVAVSDWRVPSGTGSALTSSCSSNNRGAIFYQPGSLGVKDQMQVCMKDSADNYGWRSLN